MIIYSNDNDDVAAANILANWTGVAERLSINDRRAEAWLCNRRLREALNVRSFASNYTQVAWAHPCRNNLDEFTLEFTLCSLRRTVEKRSLQWQKASSTEEHGVTKIEQELF